MTTRPLTSLVGGPRAAVPRPSTYLQYSGATRDTSMTGKTCSFMPNFDSLQPPGFGSVGFGHSARQSNQRQPPFQRWAFNNRDSRYLPQGARRPLTGLLPAGPGLQAAVAGEAHLGRLDLTGYRYGFRRVRGPRRALGRFTIWLHLIPQAYQTLRKEGPRSRRGRTLLSVRFE